jgi:hypothetical protein
LAFVPASGLVPVLEIIHTIEGENDDGEKD